MAHDVRSAVVLKVPHHLEIGSKTDAVYVSSV